MWVRPFFLFFSARRLNLSYIYITIENATSDTRAVTRNSPTRVAPSFIISLVFSPSYMSTYFCLRYSLDVYYLHPFMNGPSERKSRAEFPEKFINGSEPYESSESSLSIVYDLTNFFIVKPSVTGSVQNPHNARIS